MWLGIHIPWIDSKLLQYWSNSQSNCWVIVPPTTPTHELNHAPTGWLYPGLHHRQWKFPPPPKARTQLAMKSKLYIYLPPTIDDVCLHFQNHRKSSNHSQPQELASSLTQWMNAHTTPYQLPPTIYLWVWWTILGKLHFVTVLSVVKELLIQNQGQTRRLVKGLAVHLTMRWHLIITEQRTMG